MLANEDFLVSMLVHNGHLEVANAFLKKAGLDELWVVLTPQNPHKKSAGLALNHHRLEMLKKAFSESPESIRVSDVEFSLSPPYYTANTLDHLEQEYPKVSFSILMGADCLESLSHWSRYERILEFPIFVYPRGQQNYLDSFSNHGSVRQMNSTIINISSTQIRDRILKGDSISEFVPKSVANYINKYRLYLE
jgi:nicotinate-nucleotide adenylyltransferase